MWNKILCEDFIHHPAGSLQQHINLSLAMPYCLLCVIPLIFAVCVCAFDLKKNLERFVSCSIRCHAYGRALLPPEQIASGERAADRPNHGLCCVRGRNDSGPPSGLLSSGCPPLSGGKKRGQKGVHRLKSCTRPRPRGNDVSLQARPISSLFSPFYNVPSTFIHYCDCHGDLWIQNKKKGEKKREEEIKKCTADN